MEECQWLRVSHPKGKEIESRSLLFSLLSHWTWISFCYFILKAPLRSCGPHKVLLSLPYTHCLQDSRGFFLAEFCPAWTNQGYIFLQLKVVDLCKRKIKISCSFQGIFLSLRVDDSLWKISLWQQRQLLMKSCSIFPCGMVLMETVPVLEGIGKCEP